jgi:hypothetical protein
MASIWSRRAWMVCCSWAPSSANRVRSRLTELVLVDLRQFQAFAQAGDGLPQLRDFALGADQRRAHGIVGIGAGALEFLAQCRRGGFQLLHFVVVDDAFLLHRLVALGARLFQLLAQGGRRGLEHLRFLAGGDALVLDRLFALDAGPLEFFAQGADRGLSVARSRRRLAWVARSVLPWISACAASSSVRRAITVRFMSRASAWASASSSSMVETSAIIMRIAVDPRANRCGADYKSYAILYPGAQVRNRT